MIYEGDCLSVLPVLGVDSIDSVVTDPPYGLSFMGKDWDHGVPGVHFWVEALRVAKPGAFLLAFGGTRTFHRLTCAIEDAGWEIRDCVMWVYGSGFPKSHNIGNGWGTALKPAWEPIIVARKPIVGTVADNVLRYGTGAMNIDGCRVGTAVETWPKSRSYAPGQIQPGGVGITQPTGEMPAGRWPANLIHDGSDEVVGLFPQSTVTGKRTVASRQRAGGNGNPFGGTNLKESEYTDSGSAARFFKCCPPDNYCPYCLTLREACDNDISKPDERIDLWKKSLVHNAEKNGWTSQATKEFIAQISAIGSQNESLVQNVKSAGNLCDLCAMNIAVALVGVKTSDFNKGELQVILDSIGSYKSSILIQNLVSFAELWESIDTIPTTTSLMILFGSVNHAITNYTPETEKNVQKRFIYTPKASKADRDEGCEGLPEVLTMRYSEKAQGPLPQQTPSKPVPQRNHHPTVKPTALMRYLCRLVTPPGGTVLDPFMGSGSTGKAAALEGFKFIGIELEKEYTEIAERRIGATQPLLQAITG